MIDRWIAALSAAPNPCCHIFLSHPRYDLSATLPSLSEQPFDFTMHYNGHRESIYVMVKTKAKVLSSKALAEHFCHIKYAQLNSDVFTGIVDIGWRQMVDEYHHAKQVEELQYASIYELAFS